MSEKAVDCENTELFAGWIEGDGGGTRHRELLFCGSEVALNSDVAAFAEGSDIEEHCQNLEKKQGCGRSLLKLLLLYGLLLLPARFDKS